MTGLKNWRKEPAGTKPTCHCPPLKDALMAIGKDIKKPPINNTD